ncbi:ArdC-like ssDNA-binding domain-containing protein [Gloeothece verrucosa]|uniref:Uncharacterized protein n=1 Tax=Gloeothece verrucosa (strain PCC 7822) TaxID=497965 RepID=E0UMR1_GLOV7|nr:ArdC-like ssDNA-binding domain-containing protein [Gloeothece verrucosa]ADN18241.1 protein of unknown function DUF955 [Gloeothece verrucosa PCC 7822]
MEKTKDALEKLEAGISELLTSNNWQQYLKKQSQFHRYSFNNTMLILLQCPHASRVAGYQQWQNLGRQVKKGEKGIKILAPLKRKVERETDNGNPEFKWILNGFKIVSVFDISQTEGDDLPQIVSSLTGDDQGLLNRLVAFSENNKVPVYFKGALGANGYCRYDRITGEPKEIVVDPLLPPLGKAKTLAHEIAHSILHKRGDYVEHTPTSTAELEAESVAFVILQHFGLDSSNYSFGYICSWQQEKDAIEQLKRSGASIQKAAQQVIDFLSIQSSYAVA